MAWRFKPDFFEEFPQSREKSGQQFGGYVLQNRDRVNAIEACLGDLQAIGEKIADKPEAGILSPESLEFARPVTGPVIGIDDPHFIPQTTEQITDQGLTGADLQQLSSAADVAQNRLQHPGALNVLQISVSGRQRRQMVDAVAEIGNGRIAERRDLEIHLVFRGHLLQCRGVHPDEGGRGRRRLNVDGVIREQHRLGERHIARGRDRRGGHPLDILLDRIDEGFEPPPARIIGDPQRQSAKGCLQICPSMPLVGFQMPRPRPIRSRS